MTEASAILALAHRDFIKLLRDRQRMVADFAFPLIFIGILGGFTTFSAFGNETLNLWRDGENALAMANIAAHLVLCLAAVWLSRALAYEIWR